MNNLESIVNNFADKRVAVFGDIMLDEYIYGSTDRISPEAPVPIVEIKAVEYRLGGAANVANNIRSLKGNPILIGVIGNDDNGKKLKHELDAVGISHDLIQDNERPTTIKTRVVSHNHQVVRLDKESKKYVKKDTELSVINKAAQIIPNCDVVILSDYSKGFLTERVCFEIISLCKKNGKTVIVDPKSKFSKYSRASVVTPNLKELRELSGLFGTDDSIAKNVLRDNDLEALLVTKGEYGMSLYKRDGKILDVPAVSNISEVTDVSGAGDTAIAIFGLALGSGSSIEDAVILSNFGSSVSVRKLGTAIVSVPEMLEELNKSVDIIERKFAVSDPKSLDDIVKIVEDLKRDGKKIVTTNGCFDILHVGHLQYLKEAKKLGDVLIVGVNSDKSVKLFKGPDRPINNEAHRIEVLLGLSCVDYAFIFDDREPSPWIEKIKPDVHVKGGDYTIGQIIEKDAVERNGGRIVLVRKFDSPSTTDIIKNIRGV